ncbi:outer membrane efflux protein [Neorickettsia risticii str. Illinois]|uniref:Outer membrane efflux protein n=1 Tax=Neorickettsia risticii (strain Illinois) TaxID=434131 RepID=C6V5S1_NEORI|nr:outer membrane efflux protein [Neorickettsia risticii str. Illinois]
MHVKMRLLIFLLLWFTFVDFAYSYSLEDAFHDTLLNNDTVKSLSKQHDLAFLRRRMSVSELLPTASLGLLHDFNREFWAPVGSAKTNPVIGLTVTQNIGNPFAPLSKLFLAKHEYLNATFLYADAIHNVMLHVMHAYLEAIRTEEILALHKETLRALEMNLDAVQKSLKLGESTKGELAYAKAKLLSARSQFLESKSKAESSRASLCHLVGRKSIQTKLEDPILKVEYLPRTLQECVILAFANNTPIKAAKNAIESAKLKIVESVGRWLPAMSLETTLRYVPSKKTIAGGFQNVGTHTTISISLPLFTGGRNTLAVAMAYEDKSLKEHEYHAKSKLLEEEVQNTWNDYHNALLFASALKELVKASNIAADSIRQEAHLNLKSNLNVIDAELELLKVKTQLRQAEAAKVGAFYKLLFMIYGHETLDILLREDLDASAQQKS